MTDGDALRRAVVANPDDDTPRLVYADWLDENGQPDRAAFIRDQIEAVRADPFGPQAREAEQRARRRYVEQQSAVKMAYRRWRLFEIELRRGFVWHVEALVDFFVPAAEYLFDAEPLQSFRPVVYGALEEPALAALLAVPGLHRLRRFGLNSCPMSPDGFARLAEAPGLAGLRDLEFHNLPVPPRWLTDTLAGKAFPDLAGLKVTDIPNLGRGLAAGCARADHRDLRRLDVRGVVFTSDDLRTVLQSRCLRRAEELNLAWGGWAGRAHEPGPLAHLDLGWVIPWERLVTLDLTGQRVGDEGVRAIVAQRDAAALRRLDLGGNDLTPESARMLAGAKHLNLNYLNVSGNGFRDSDHAPIRARFPDAVVIA